MDILPITVIAAIILFLIKETIEQIRRRNTDRRKVHALKALLSRECELNFWTIKSLRRILNDLAIGEGEERAGCRFSTRTTPTGELRAVLTRVDDGVETSSPIPKAYRELMSKYLLDIATLDMGLFAVLEPAFDELAELDHVRQSLIEVNDRSEVLGADSDSFASSFAVYGLNALNGVEEKLASLYKYCTGLSLEKHRLR